jgi:hypothetical protein
MLNLTREKEILARLHGGGKRAHREKLVGVASCYDTEWWPGTGDCRRRLPMEPSSSTSQRQPPALLHASLPPVLHHTELLMAPLLPPNTAIATLLVLTGHREYGCSSVPPCPWPAQPATAGSESVANEQQATYHISAKLFYVSSQLSSNKKNSQPEEWLHGEFLLKEMHVYKPWRWRTIRHAKLAANRMVAVSGISQRCQEGCRWRVAMETNSSISRKAASCSSLMPSCRQSCALCSEVVESSRVELGELSRHVDMSTIRRQLDVGRDNNK